VPAANQLEQAKLCNRCDAVKPASEFYARHDTRRPKGPCKECRLTELKSPANRRKNADSKRRQAYGITQAQYDRLYFEQAGLCAICRQPETRLHGRYGVPFNLGVDHNHTTGSIRGLLCNTCNRALGLMGDDPSIFEAALRYLLGAPS